MTSCATCRFAIGFPAPASTCPKTPEPPIGFLARLFWDGEGEWWRHQIAVADHRDAIYRHEELVRCRRFPEFVTMEKSDVCGEHSPIIESMEAA